MTPQQIADQIAELETKLSGLRDLQKAQRPALAAGQVWRSPEWGVSIVCAWDGVSGSIYNIERQSLVPYASGLADCFVFLGLARDVLRVVPPDAGVAMKQVAPVQDEPTGAELVKRLCWVREEEGSPWIGPAVIDQWDKEGRDGLWYMTMDDAVAGAWFIDAKLYREGVTP